MQKKQGGESAPAVGAIASAFIEARESGLCLAAYPGEPPESLAAAYAIQDEAIRLWPDEIAGWKVGRIVGEAETAFGCDRLAGPIFRRSIFSAATSPIPMPVFKGGFAAVEAECVLILREDAPADKTQWSLNEAKAMIGKIAAGVEIASSPFPGINDLGPAVTVSDFGNNFGLIIGDELPDWRKFDFPEWRFETLIDGKLVAENDAGSIPRGPVESLRFLLENTAQRGLPLKKGMAVSSGAVTGVHEMNIGQRAVVRFNGLPDIECTLVSAGKTQRAPVSGNREARA